MHYEVSNFAKGAHFRSRHNRKYWDHTPYLGLGPSAHSFSGQKRWWNLRSIRKYCSALEAGGLPVEGSEDLTPEQIRLETLALGLRTKEGVDRDVIPHTPILPLCLKGSGMRAWCVWKGRGLCPPGTDFWWRTPFRGVFFRPFK